jgi:hypothetical protein
LINFFNPIYIDSAQGISMNRIYLFILLTITLLISGVSISVSHVEHKQPTIKQLIVDVSVSTVVADELSLEDTDTDLLTDLAGLTQILPRILHSIKPTVTSICTLFISNNDIRGPPLSF